MAQFRRERRPIDGVLLLDKSVGVSSNHALQRVKHLYRAERAGHTGTLDPLASGLLPITLGEGTKYSGYLLDADKAYRAVLRLGQRTTTGDAEGEVVEERPVAVTRAQLDATIARFTGAIGQVPPMYSALKRDGRPLYELARAGITVERAARPVTISRIEIVSFDLPAVAIDVDCSKGTYIRTLAEDIGEALGCGAHLTALRRTRTGAASIADSISLERLQQLAPADLDAILFPMDRFLAHFARIDLDAAQTGALMNGQPVRTNYRVAPGMVRVFAPEGRFLGLGELDAEGELQPRRLIRTAPGER